MLGFVLGIWLAERVRLGPGQAWPSTRSALAAVGLALLVEFAAALGIAVVWVFGLLLSRPRSPVSSSRGPAPAARRRAAG